LPNSVLNSSHSHKEPLGLHQRPTSLAPGVAYANIHFFNVDFVPTANRQLFLPVAKIPSIMDFWKRAMDKRGRTVIPSTQLADKEPETRPSEENEEDESLLYAHEGRPREKKSWRRKILTAVLIVGSMVCCFAGGFLVRDLGQPRLWNFDRYETRKHQPSRRQCPI